MSVVTASVGTDCLKVTGIGLTHSSCQLYNTKCTVNAGTACAAITSCGDFSTSGTCSNFGAVKCYYNATPLCIPITSADCALVLGTGLTDAICATYDVVCISNVAGTAC